MLRGRHDEERFQVAVELVVYRRHLELVLEVRDCSQTLDDRRRSDLMREVDEQTVEGHDANVVEIAGCLLRKRHALLKGEQRFFLHRLGNGDDDFVDKLRRAGDDIEMPHRNRVERARR